MTDQLSHDRTAVVIVHGIGQQRPFEALGTFAAGLRAALHQAGFAPRQQHVMTEERDSILHSVRIDGARAGERASMDVFEVYWASMCQRKATLRDLLRWLTATGLTPVKRLAFNLPLIAKRAEARGGSARRFWYVWEFVREVVRSTSLLFFGFLVALAVTRLVDQAPQYWKALKGTVGPLLQLFAGFGIAATTLVVLVALVSAVTLAISIATQIRELALLEQIEPSLIQREKGRFAKIPMVIMLRNARSALQRASTGGGDRLKPVPHVDDSEERIRRYREGRKVFLGMSIALAALGAILFTWFALLPICVGPVCPSPLLARQLTLIPWGTVLPPIVFLALGAAITRVMLDYVGDVAVYTSSDENSAFFATRSEILKHSMASVRRLLRDPQYSRVVLCGHSLGSVIAYDTLNKLRTESRVAKPAGSAMTTADELKKLHMLVTFGSPLNKVLYFFRVRLKAHEIVRAHIVEELHGFRRPQDILTQGEEIGDNAPASEHDPTWLNFSALLDPVSAELDYYDRVEEHRRWYWVWGAAHMRYWHDDYMYAAILRNIPTTPAGPVMAKDARYSTPVIPGETRDPHASGAGPSVHSGDD